LADSHSTGLGEFALLSPDVVDDFSQTRQHIIGREAYLKVNEDIADHSTGNWRFMSRRIIAHSTGAASWVDFNTTKTVTVITFFCFTESGLMSVINHFCPEPYAPPSGREHLVERY
jgi:hypothetical protein